MRVIKVVVMVMVLVLYCDCGASRINKLTQRRTNHHRNNEILERVPALKWKQNITIPLQIHIDKHVKKQFRNESFANIRRITKNIIENVNKEFRDISKHYNIHFKVRGVLFPKFSFDSPDISQYLQNYCNWQFRRKTKGWYYSLLLSGMNLVSISNGKQNKQLGRSFQNGVCKRKVSCAIAKFVQPKQMVHIISHELAHAMGVYHDGEAPNKKCSKKGFLMTPIYFPKHAQKDEWSTCSRNNIERFFKSRHFGKCLKEFNETYA